MSGSTSRGWQRVLVYAPVLMSIAGLAIVSQAFGMKPADYPKDEGWEAHTWQLLMFFQLPFIALSVVSGLRPLPRMLSVLVLQLLLFSANLAIVYALKL